jgi:hypothetical protein
VDPFLDPQLLTSLIGTLELAKTVGFSVGEGPLLPYIDLIVDCSLRLKDAFALGNSRLILNANHELVFLDKSPEHDGLGNSKQLKVPFLSYPIFSPELSCYFGDVAESVGRIRQQLKQLYKPSEPALSSFLEMERLQEEVLNLRRTVKALEDKNRQIRQSSIDKISGFDLDVQVNHLNPKQAPRRAVQRKQRSRFFYNSRRKPSFSSHEMKNRKRTSQPQRK